MKTSGILNLREKFTHLMLPGTQLYTRRGKIGIQRKCLAAELATTFKMGQQISEKLAVTVMIVFYY
jgi:hypothetical protein